MMASTTTASPFVLTEDIMKQALLRADHLTHRQLRFGLGVGARIVEIENLTWRDVDLPNGRVWFEQRMTAAGGRFVPLPATILTMLWDMKVWKEGGATSSVWAESGGISNTQLRTRWCRLFSKWKRDYERGTERVPPPNPVPPVSEIRRLSIQMLLDRGVPADQVAVWAGRIVQPSHRTGARECR